MPQTKRWLLLCALAVAGCGESAPSPTPSPLVPEPVAVPETPVETAAAPAAVLCAVGFTSDPPIPEAARTANANALRIHGPEHYEESERGFAEATALAPNYRSARFNHACALTRLNRLDEAWSELMPLLCEDLPSYGPRVMTDEDLAALREREGSHLEQVLSTIADRYRTTAATGTPLVAFEHGPRRDPMDGGGTLWEESQAGAYLPAEHRFLPMGPRLHERGLPEPRSGSGGYALNATRYFPDQARVLALLVRGSDAEGGPELGPVEARLYEAATGNLIFTHRFSAIAGWLTGGLENENTVVVGFEDLDDRIHFRLDIDRTGGRRSRGETPAVGVLSAGGVTWNYIQGGRIAADHGATVTLPDGRVLTLGPAPRSDDRWVRTTSQNDVVWVVTDRHGDCSFSNRYRVERMVVSTGERNEIHAGDGDALFEEGNDGALYLQVGDVLHRFPDLGAGPGEELWPGLGITSMANDFNPMC